MLPLLSTILMIFVSVDYFLTGNNEVGNSGFDSRSSYVGKRNFMSSV